MNVDFQEQDIIIEFTSEGQDGKSVRPMGEWSDTEPYKTLDLVTYQGDSYIAIKTVPVGTLPTDTEYWMINASNQTTYWGTIAGTLSNQTDLQSALNDKADADAVYTKTETDTLLAAKADADDVYTKTETDNLLSDKADADQVYTKSETDTLLSAKADTSTVYTTGQVDTLLSAKADSDDVYTKSQTYSKTEVDNALSSKANAADVYTKTQADNLLSAKANTADLGALADQDSVDYETEVTNKPDFGDMAFEDDAPSDDKIYGRKNGGWAEVTGGISNVAWGDITGTLSDQTDLQAALLAKAPVILASASGAIASFSDGSPAPVTALTVDIDPVQDLSNGDPSPTNVCPISGWSQAHIYREAEYDADADPQITIDLDGTRYGGTVNVLTGEMTVDRAMITYTGASGENWSYWSGAGGTYSITIIGMKSGSNLDGIANWLPTVSNTEFGIRFGANNNIIYCYSINDKIASVTDTASWKSYLASNNLTVVYPLATPFTVQLTPSQMQTLLGDNAIWSDTGDTSVQYRADTKLFIEGQIAQSASVTRQMIADTANGNLAPKSLASGDLIIVGDELRKCTANIGNGSAITDNNSTVATLADVIKALQ